MIHSLCEPWIFFFLYIDLFDENLDSETLVLQIENEDYYFLLIGGFILIGNEMLK